MTNGAEDVSGMNSKGAYKSALLVVESVATTSYAVAIAWIVTNMTAKTSLKNTEKRNFYFYI